MKKTIDVNCPHCHSAAVTQNGKKSNGKQNYLCKDCVRQFIPDHERACKGTLSWVKDMIKIMLVRGVVIRDIGIILKISAGTALKVLKSTGYRIKPKQSHYDCLETGEFWTYGGKKENEQPQGKPCGIF
jgi:transposase-like protein